LGVVARVAYERFQRFKDTGYKEFVAMIERDARVSSSGRVAKDERRVGSPTEPDPVYDV